MNSNLSLRALQESWVESGLAGFSIGLGQPHIIPTFLEHIGKASAENTRSAALVSWFNRDPTGSARIAFLRHFLPNCSDRPGPYCAVRELSLSKSCRVDIAFFDGAGNLAACVEVKWLAEAKTEQLRRYKEALDDREIGKDVVLNSLTPVEVVGDIGEGARFWRSARWGDVAEYVRGEEAHASSADYELGRSLARIQSLDGTARSLVRERGTLAEAHGVFNWLRNAGAERRRFNGFEIAVDDSHAELFKRLLLTELAEATVRKLSSLGIAGAWRRVRTVNGPHGDTQSDLAPAAFSDGRILMASLERCVGIFVRFHADQKFRRITTQIGTQVHPYLEGKERRAWIEQNGDAEKAIMAGLRKARERVRSACRSLNLPENGGSTDSSQWYKRFSHQEHTPDAVFDDVIERACDLANCINSVLENAA